MPRPSLVGSVAALAAIVGAVHAAPLAAQAAAADSAALPFRRGQWGVEVDLVSGFSHIGFLHFRSERAAWIVGLSFNGGKSRNEFDAAGDSLDYVREYDNVSANVSAGLRRYRPINRRGVAYTTIGASVGGHASVVEYDDGETYGDSHSWRGGVFGEVGGAWLVTRNLTLGASYSIGFSYSRSVLYGPGSRSTQSGFGAGGGNSNLLATIVF